VYLPSGHKYGRVVRETCVFPDVKHPLSDIRQVIRPGGGEETVRFLRNEPEIEDFVF